MRTEYVLAASTLGILAVGFTVYLVPDLIQSYPKDRHPEYRHPMKTSTLYGVREQVEHGEHEIVLGV